jgi:DNA-directed RNA polymerase specialized sigma24 family protein
MNDLISQLYKNKEVAEAISYHFPDHCKEDIKQDLFENLINLAPGTLEAINGKGKLRQYIATIISNMKHQRYGKVAKMVGQYTFSNPLPENMEQEDSGYNDATDIAFEKIEKIDWYKRGILELYVKLGTVRAVSIQTKIPFDSVKYAITQARKEIKSAL